MKQAIIVPARVSSTRFPQKLLHEVRGKPVLLWTANLLLNVSTAINLGDWFGPTQLIGPTAVGFLIIWGAVTSVAGGSLFHDPLVHAPRPTTRTSV